MYNHRHKCNTNFRLSYVLLQQVSTALVHREVLRSHLSTSLVYALIFLILKCYKTYKMGTGGSFPGVKRQGREADHSPPTSAEVMRM
jgi:hypothetical protein